jgi:VanZ family protein
MINDGRLKTTFQVHLTLSTLFTVACLLLIYASIVPLGFRPIPIQEAIECWGAISWLRLDIYRRSDWIANGIVVVPVAFLLCGALSFKVQSNFQAFVNCLLAVGLVCFLVLGIEFLQIWFPRRTLSKNDMLAGCLGSVVGGVSWLLFGKRLTREIELACRSPIKAERVSRIAFVLSLIAVFQMLFPFDFVMSLGELSKKYFVGGSSKTVFWSLIGLPIDWIDIFRNFLRYIPVGVWYACSRGKRSGVFFYLLLPLCLELLQFFLFSRNASVMDAFVGGLGILTGSRINFNNLACRIKALSKPLVLLVLLCYLSILLFATLSKAESCVANFDQIRSRFGLFFPVPLSRYYLKSEFAAFNLVFSKLVAFIPIGFLLGRLFDASEGGKRMRVVVFSSVVLGILLELVQVFAPPLIPDFWDTIFYSFGGVVGFHFLETTLMHAEPDASTACS